MANLVGAALSTLLLQLLWGKCFFAKVKVKLSKWSILLLKVKFGKEVCICKISRGAPSGCPLSTAQEQQLSETEKFFSKVNLIIWVGICEF